MRATTLALVVLVLAAPPVMAQDDATAEAIEASDDCAFLQRSFAGVYEGLRAMSGGDVERARPELVTMFTAIQTNIILMAQGAGCEMGPMIETARAQLERYAGED